MTYSSQSSLHELNINNKEHTKQKSKSLLVNRRTKREYRNIIKWSKYFIY